MATLATNHELLLRIKQAAYGDSQGSGQGDRQFEQSFNSIAMAIMQEKAPQLMEFLIGAQLVSRDDEASKAVMVMGFKIGNDYVYVPLIFLKGNVKGSELGYLKSKDKFFPLSEDWVNHLLSRRPQQLGHGVPRDLSRIGVLPPDLRSFSSPAGKFASDTRLASWLRDGLDGMIREADKQAGMPSWLTQNRDRTFLKCFLEGLASFPKYAEAFDKLHGVRNLDSIVKSALPVQSGVLGQMPGQPTPSMSSHLPAAGPPGPPGLSAGPADFAGPAAPGAQPITVDTPPPDTRPAELPAVGQDPSRSWQQGLGDYAKQLWEWSGEHNHIPAAALLASPFALYGMHSMMNRPKRRGVLEDEYGKEGAHAPLNNYLKRGPKTVNRKPGPGMFSALDKTETQANDQKDFPFNKISLSISTTEEVLTGVLPVSSDREKEKLLADGLAITDTREEHTKVIPYRVVTDHAIANPDMTGIYEVLTGPGEFKKCLVVMGPMADHGPEARCALVINHEGDTYRYRTADPKAVWVKPEVPDLKAITEYVEKCQNTQDPKPSYSAKYIMIAPNGSATVPFEIRSEDGDEGGRKWCVYFNSYVEHSDYRDHNDYWSNLPGQYTRNGRYRLGHDTYSQGPAVAINHRPGTKMVSSGNCVYGPPGSKIVQLRPNTDKHDHMTDRPSPRSQDHSLSLADGNDLTNFLEAKMASLRLDRDLGGMKLNGVPFSKNAAVIHLVRDWGLAEQDARNLLHEADQVGYCKRLLDPIGYLTKEALFGLGGAATTAQGVDPVRYPSHLKGLEGVDLGTHDLNELDRVNDTLPRTEAEHNFWNSSHPDMGYLPEFQEMFKKVRRHQGNPEVLAGISPVKLQLDPKKYEIQAMLADLQARGHAGAAYQDSVLSPSGTRHNIVYGKSAAQEYDLQQGGPVSPPWPPQARGVEFLPGRGYPAAYPEEHNLPVHDLAAQTEANSQRDRLLLPDRDELQLATQAAGSGQREVFDLSSMTSVLKATQNDTMVDQHLPHFEDYIDRVGRILLNFYYHGDKFQDRYGKKDMPELESLIRTSFESAGELYLYLRQKTVEPSGDGDSSVDLSTSEF